mmetsp:Transcript_108867/g.198275  ORF Transcript_108867/g.198275 Transcript_108867/m.198275 type:complete len:94 (-) Transcript_108867:144-425(-)
MYLGWLSFGAAVCVVVNSGLKKGAGAGGPRGAWGSCLMDHQSVECAIPKYPNSQGNSTWRLRWKVRQNAKHDSESGDLSHQKANCFCSCCVPG